MNRFRAWLDRLDRRPPNMVRLMLAFMAAGYAASLLVSRELGALAGEAVGTSPSSMALRWMGGNQAGETLNGDWFRLLTAIFLHGSLLHILCNTLCTLNVGPIVVRLYDEWRFLTVWILTGFAASIASGLWQAGGAAGDLLLLPGSVGASGSGFGILFFLFGALRHASDPGSLAVRRQIVFWTLINVVVGMQLNVDHAGHAGGALMGYVLSVVMDRTRFRRFHRILNGSRLPQVLFLILILAFGSVAWNWFGPKGQNFRRNLAMREIVFEVLNTPNIHSARDMYSHAREAGELENRGFEEARDFRLYFEMLGVLMEGSTPDPMPPHDPDLPSRVLEKAAKINEGLGVFGFVMRAR